MNTHLKRRFVAALSLLLMGAFPTYAAEGTIDVVLNQAKIVKLSRAADTIVIGNPDIADASVKDSKTIVITGKYFGVTNFVVLDVKGDPIVDQQISVSRSISDTVNIYRQATVQTLSCTPFCEPVFRSEVETRVATEAAQ